jgi:NADH:ubiquinone reductase (H+-translocating)
MNARKHLTRLWLEEGSGPHRVVIVGSGFGGLFAARALRRAAVEVTVIDRTNHHLFQPLLYQLATGVLSEGDIAAPTREVLRRQTNVRVLLGEVVHIDLGTREIVLDTLGERSRVPYDSLIVASGARQSYLGHDEFAPHALGLKTIKDALELRERIFGAFEMAEMGPARQNAWLTFAVVGAGPTGVEIAGQIAELARRARKRNYRNFDPSRARVVLLDSLQTVLPTFPEPLQRRAQRDLEHLGVEVCLGRRVTGVDLDGVDFEGPAGAVGRIDAYTKVWAAGVEASPLGAILAEQSGARVDRDGRVKVMPDCTLPGCPEVFVVGDLMALKKLPGLADVAMQSGAHAARQIERRVHGHDEPEPFVYRDPGQMAAIARFRAVGWVGRMRVTGLPGWLIWLVVYLTFLTGFKNRLAVIVSWGFAFLGRGPRQRVITEQHALARSRMLIASQEATPAR